MKKEKIEKKIDELSNINKKVTEKMFGYILTAFGLVAGLAWNDAIKSLIEYFFPLERNGIWAKFFYAFIFTVIVVMVSLYVAKIFKKDDNLEKDKK
ncbi:MAG: hypothetical protein COZ85_03105 [Candidatus Moranbacteria bacterium CG_4_8_14_3_um_filter_34_16]|nr:MAG: hypothetical protein COT31_00515 [Candidatus Moranbacteria bacterium CG08_land_8_20_14_0_20_34_16]PIW94840.1 MAG: hypothetical protein COZ85_03105 [Candidatus Moranbacteria bacterium CG_4_8_14_3_um_filter_34_16]PJA89041.1 MAG: hypothetical protein CO138_02515 [Candidatus Moranbacteria bacterium CG_4_9_14_3_um_filter_33_15]